MKIKSDMSNEDIDRWVDLVKEFGITEALRIQKEIEKNKKKMKRILSND